MFVRLFICFYSIFLFREKIFRYICINLKFCIMRNLILLKQYAPVIFDATHSVQIPSTGGTTGGNSSFVPAMAKAAAAVGVDGFFFETHIDPSVAKSDGPNMLKIEDLYKTVGEIFAIQEALGYLN